MSRKPDRRPPPADATTDSQQRLQKVLAAAGLGSRRNCEELITAGRVEIDRRVVTELGTKVDPTSQEIRVDGAVLHRPKRRLYFALNKPEGVVTTNFDPSGRTRVIDLVPTQERVFPIGRLDRGSEGLILVTNDGDLANRVTHPRYGLEKTYQVRVEGTPTPEELAKLRRGVYIAEGMARVESVKVKSRLKHVSDLEIVLREGKNREIRRILAKIGHKVLKLRRTSVGPVKLGELRPGACRKLMPEEIEALQQAAQGRRKTGKRPDARSGERPARSEKPATAHREPPAPPPAIPGAAPPKIDLATLLNPASAPQRAMAVTPPPRTAAPAIGEVLGYDAAEDQSLAELPQRQRKRRRQVREYEPEAPPIEELGEPPPEHQSAEREAVRPRRPGKPSRRLGKPPDRPGKPPGRPSEPTARPGKKAARVAGGRPTGKPPGKRRPATGHAATGRAATGHPGKRAGKTFRKRKGK
jgi:23S rRNA pseudouridine2605 synthase